MDIKTAEEIYKLTGKNVIFEIDDPKNSDPQVWRVLIWKYRQATEPEAKLEDVKELDVKEMIAAYKFFFRREE